MADCCLIKKVATVEVYENKNEVRAYGFMAGDRNTPVMEVRFKHLWGESNLSTCKLRWIIVDDVGSLLVGEVPIQSDNTALINLPNELFTGDRRMKVQLTVASCDGERILNLQQFTDLKVINSLASNEIVEPVYDILINKLYDETFRYLKQLDDKYVDSVNKFTELYNTNTTNFTNLYDTKYTSLNGLYLDSRRSLEDYMHTAENGGNANSLQGNLPRAFSRVENTIEELINSANGKYREGDVVELLGYYTAGDGAGHKRKIEATDDGSGVQLANGLWANIIDSGITDIKSYGAIGDGTSDDTIPFKRAISVNNARGGTIFLPQGKYKITEKLDFKNAGLRGVSVKGSNFEAGAEICSYVINDYTMTLSAYRGQVWGGFSIKSYGTSQHGLCIFGTPTLENIRIEGFDGVSFRVGSGSGNDIVPAPKGVGKAGCYYAKIDNITIVNNSIIDKNAIRGVFVDGGFPSSNANTFRNVVVNGRFDILYQINGTTNSFYGGDCDPSNAISKCVAAFKINGTNIKIREMYYELDIPEHLIWFESDSVGCEISDLHMQGYVQYGNMESIITDMGMGNNVKFKPVGYNYGFPKENKSFQNLVPNSTFSIWMYQHVYGQAPHGWVVNGGQCELDKENNRTPTANSIKCSKGSVSNFNIACVLTSKNTNLNSQNQISVEQLRGKTLVASVWARSNSNEGVLKIQAGAAYGQSRCDGSGGWQLLTAMAKVPNDFSGDIAIQLRNGNSGETSSDTVWFSEPCMYIGSELSEYEPRPLCDNLAQMFGAFFLSPTQTISGSTPDVSNGNIFSINNTTPTDISNFLGVQNRREGQVIYIISTNSNSRLINGYNIYTGTGANVNLETDKVYQLIYSLGKWKLLTNTTQGISSLNTPYHTAKMQQEGVYDDFIQYMDEKTEYDRLQRELEQQRQLEFEQSGMKNYEEWLSQQPMMLPSDSEPVPSVKLMEFKKKYSG